MDCNVLRNTQCRSRLRQCSLPALLFVIVIFQINSVSYQSLRDGIVSRQQYIQNNRQVDIINHENRQDSEKSHGKELQQKEEEELLKLLSTTDGSHRCRSRVLVGARCFCQLAPDTYHAWKDGTKMVCLDYLDADKECRVLSFGIDNDFSFDLGMQDLGCTVHSFDPTIGISDYRHSIRVFFHNAGLSAQDTNRTTGSSVYKLVTLDTAAEIAGWSGQAIDYLKLDIESSEWSVLKQQLTSTKSTLHRVRQLQIEIHLMSWQPEIEAGYTRLLANEMVPAFVSVLHQLQTAGFRLVYTRPYYHCKQLAEGCLAYLYDTHWLNVNMN